MINVGVFGGSFNPPHLAHQMLLRAALATGAVETVWMVPTFQHAFGKDLAPYDDRVAMSQRIASEFGGRVVVSRLEEELGGESRTLPLLERMAALLPEARFRLLIGADILAEAHKWYRWDDVAALAPPLVFGRAGAPPPTAGTPAPALTLPDISSTEARRQMRAGQASSPLLPEAVVRYIVSRSLYRP